MRLLTAAVLATLLALAALAPAPAEAKLPAKWMAGSNVTAFWWRDFTDGGYDYWIKRLRDNGGARWAMLTSSWYQYASDGGKKDSEDATDIRPSYGSFKSCRKQDGSDFRLCKTPPPSAMRSAILKAKGLGLRVAVKPLLEVGRGASSAGKREAINKGTDRAEWFAAYRRFLAVYARVARDARAEMLVIGTGLSGMTDEQEDRDAWRAIIAGIRSGALMGGGGGYTGLLTFGANWDALADDALDPESQRGFWDALDVIGVEGYFPLSRQPDPSVDALKKGWYRDIGGYGAPPVDLMRRLNQEYGKPVFMTGLGYASKTATALNPNERNPGGKVSQEAQSRAYAAAFDVWTTIAREEKWFRGIFWWDWPANGRKDAGGFTPETKSAEKTLCRAQGGAGGATKRCYR